MTKPKTLDEWAYELTAMLCTNDSKIIEARDFLRRYGWWAIRIIEQGLCSVPPSGYGCAEYVKKLMQDHVLGPDPEDD